MNKRIYNFSAGPAVLPLEVLEEAKEALISYKDSGIGIAEMSHRSKEYDAVIEGAASDLKNLLGINDEFEVLFLGGGASLQFYMVPLNLAQGKKVSYINTGEWSKKAVAEAKKLSSVEVIASSEDKNFCYIPEINNMSISPESTYLHFTSNNTIFGTEYRKEPTIGGNLLVCDASSNFLSKEIDIKRYGLIYAGAQKNLGPAGVTVVLIRKDFLAKCDSNLPPMLSYITHAKNKSMYNTPPTFPVYVVGLVLKWLKKLGGLKAMQKINEEKAEILYSALLNSDFYKPTAEKNSRSNMNVTFVLSKPELEDKFISEATKSGFSGLKGHRSVGGMRASIYNAFPKQGIIDLVSFMKDFEKKNG